MGRCYECAEIDGFCTCQRDAAARLTGPHDFDTETLAAACRTAAVASAHADLLNAAAARLLAMASWIDGARIDIDGLEVERDDWRRRYEALRDGVTGLCEQADRSHDEYLRGLILDRFIVPSNVTVSRIRAVVARVEET